MTNLFIVIMVSTNWLSVSGDFKHEDNTNYVKQAQVVSTNVWVEEIRWCTNKTLLRQDYAQTNGIRWVPVTTPPGTPGRL